MMIVACVYRWRTRTTSVTDNDRQQPIWSAITIIDGDGHDDDGQRQMNEQQYMRTMSSR